MAFFFGSHFLLSLSLVLFDPPLSEECNRASQLFALLQSEHLEPKASTDSLSSEIYDEFFLQLDPMGVLFCEDDIRSLEPYRFHLHDDLVNRPCAFPQAATRVFQRSLLRSKIWVDSLLRQPMDFNKKHFWNSSSPVKRPTHVAALQLQLEAQLKYEVVMMIFRLHQLDATELDAQTFYKLLPTAQKRVLQSFNKSLDDLIQNVSSSTNTYFLKSIALVFDPHTEYLTKAEMEKYREATSTERLSFGIDLSENTWGEVRVARLIPGGPAWKSGQIHQGDLLVQVKWPIKDAVDLLDYDADEVDELLHSSEQLTGELTVINSTGEKRIVQLTKERIENTENTISSFILSGSQRIGYIYLPGFFTDETDQGLNGCANEVAKEIIKLNRKGIQGLIMDLRFNGGGSLEEAVDLVGVFIDAGPVTIFDDKGGSPVTLRDVNKGQAYNGPILVMINGASASASEIVAAALQDHQRAVIVGNTSFGKATGQVLRPLREGVEEDGYLKLTASRLYRLNQKSLQHVGVIPDIIIPDLTVNLVKGEKVMRHSLLPKTVNKKTYYQPSVLPELSHLKEASRHRIESDPHYQSVEALSRLLEKPFPLDITSYIAMVNELLRNIANIKASGDSLPFTIEANLAESGTDPLKKIMSEKSIDEIRFSIYIREAYTIMNDILLSGK